MSSSRERSVAVVEPPAVDHGPQIWHVWPEGWPCKPGDKALCGTPYESGQAKREPHELCVVCEGLR